MEYEFLKVLAAFLLVVFLIITAAIAFKMIFQSKTFSSFNSGKRIKIEEVKMLDTKRKIAIVTIDDEEYAILLGIDNDILLSKKPVNDNKKIEKAKKKDI